jgi:Fur family transcriptional regulator, ferric uptake regulator
LSTLERAGGFASAQEIYRLMQREGESIGLTTVYRSLQSLVNDKIVDVLRRDDGDTVEIEGGAIEKWAKVMAEEHGFRDVGHTAEIFGICSKC